MKSRALTCIPAMMLFVALVLPAQSAAQHTRYKLVAIDTFGGPSSAINVGDGVTAVTWKNPRMMVNID